MLTQMTAESELGEASMTQSLKENLISLKTWDFLRTSSNTWEVIGLFVFFAKYGNSKILR